MNYLKNYLTDKKSSFGLGIFIVLDIFYPGSDKKRKRNDMVAHYAVH